MTSLASIAVNDVDITSQLTNATPPQEVTITWNSSFISNIDIGRYGDDFVSQDGIIARYYGDAELVDGDIEIYGGPGNHLTFTSTVGNISKVEIYYTSNANIPGDQGWTDDGTKVTWEGTPATTVTLGDRNMNINSISQIVFTIQPIQQ